VAADLHYKYTSSNPQTSQQVPGWLAQKPKDAQMKRHSRLHLQQFFGE